MNVARIFAHAVVGRVAFVLVALVLGYVGIGRADASGNFLTPQEAYASCQTDLAAYNWTALCANWTGPNSTATNQECTHAIASSTTGSYTPNVTCTGTTGATYVTGANASHYTAANCPNGVSAWGECNPDETECLARNSEEGFFNVGTVTKTFASQCTAGCMYEVVSGHQTVGFGGANEVHSGVYEWTGTCGTSVPEATKEELAAPPAQECMDDPGSLETVCVKRNGERCHTASTGFQACWTPGETGTKTDKNILQKTDPGTTPIPPSMTLPSGDTLTQKGSPTTTITKTKDANGNTVWTSTVTTTNYQTDNGTNAGPTNDGEPSDGTATGDKGGDGTEAAVKAFHNDFKGGDAVEGSADPMSVWDTTEDELQPDATGYLAAGSCPAAPEVFGQAIDIGPLCQLASIIAAMVLLMGSAHFIYAFTR